jgi:hypothetical protein
VGQAGRALSLRPRDPSWTPRHFTKHKLSAQQISMHVQAYWWSAEPIDAFHGEAILGNLADSAGSSRASPFEARRPAGFPAIASNS